MSDWDARGWIAGIMGLKPGSVTVRSIDHYGESETQVRYEHAGEAVGRLTVNGPVRLYGTSEGQGHWELKAQIGPGV